REHQVGAFALHRERGGIGQRRVVLLAAEMGQQARGPAAGTQTLGEGRTALEAGAHHLACQMPHHAGARVQTGKHTGQKGRLLLQHLVAGHVGGRVLPLGHHESGARKL
ncbi:hypothetical protein RZS08_41670, partial [Arthrospira platensis SPKY1]|nr:hypothetical protein [Arthrospira platensis SPKY1]